jgi:hypothetical protein
MTLNAVKVTRNMTINAVTVGVPEGHKKHHDGTSYVVSVVVT